MSLSSVTSRESLNRNLGPLIGSIDQGTSSSRFLVFSSTSGELITYHQIPIKSSTPKKGWIEIDPVILLETVTTCINKTVENLEALDLDPLDIVAIGLTNQRESTLLWNSETGLPLYNAIIWADTRTQSTVHQILKTIPGDDNKNFLRHLTGLPISSYFSALKIKWLMENVPDVRKSIENGTCKFGTVDSWLIYNLSSNKLHMTDVTNASRTMLMNIETLKWDPYLCQFFKIPMSILPEIRSSSEIYGYLGQTKLKGVPISGCLGDQQAALVGQNCFRAGQAKNTYGTGCFLLYNVGPRVIYSDHGLLSTVAYQMGPDEPPTYALEGAVAVAGASINWLRDSMKIIDNSSEMEDLASEVSDTGDVYFVPAFSGLFAPHWRPDARGAIVGLTQYSNRQHLCRAAFEAIAFQTREILEAMQADFGRQGTDELNTLLVDGGLSNSNLLLQIQSDFLGLPILRPSMAETTALGAAMAAGRAKGIEVWDPRLDSPSAEITTDKFLPRLTGDERDIRYDRWKEAVKRSLNWYDDVKNDNPPQIPETTRKILGSVPCALYILSSLLIYKIASNRL